MVETCLRQRAILVEKNNLLERHRWEFLTLIFVSKIHGSTVSRKSRTRVETNIRRKEDPSAMIRRLVNGFVHELRPPQLHMFISAQETEKQLVLAVARRTARLL